MAGINKAIIVGFVGKDPEIRSTHSGSRIATFSVATSETWRDKGSGERQEKTQWHNIVVFGDSAVGIIERYVNKGDSIGVEGQIETRKWQDQNGNDRYSTEIVVKQFNGAVHLLGNRNRNGNNVDRERSTNSGNAGRYGGRGGNTKMKDDLDDEIPF